MANLESIGEVFSTDVLILGAGLSGFIMAIRIKELNSKLDVLVVEKSTAGFAGSKANKGAGVMWVMQEDDDFDKFREYYCRHHGHFLEDQELLEKVCAATRPMVSHLERWGVDIMREEDGKLSRLESIPLWSLCAYDLDIMDKLRKAAVKLGVRIIDKTQSVELLTDGNRATGAVGFDLIKGTYRIFKAKSVVLATGSCNWMVTDMWYSGRGDGIAAAYRAGAEMRNAEFSNFYNIGLRGNGSALVGSQYALYNSKGEYLAPKYCADFEVDIDIGILLGMEKEVTEGKGPIVFEETELFANNPVAAGGYLFKWNRPAAQKFWLKRMEKNRKYNADHAWRPEVYPMFIGEFAAVKADHEMRTALEGMWALGDTSRSGTGWAGAVPPPSRIRGSGLTWAAVSSLLAEKSLAQYAAGASEPRIDEDQVKRFKEEIYAPMKREKGRSPRDAIWRLKEVLSPPRYGVRKSKERIEEALARVKEVWHEAETEVSPTNDWHMLGLCIDLKNMTQCADIYYNACLTRTETRGWHYREDFPKRDDKNWRKWIDIKQKDSTMVISTEDLPVERYKTKPDAGGTLWEGGMVSVGSAPDSGQRETAISTFSDRKEAVVMGDVKRTDLTPEEKAKPYSKYFYRQPALPAPERLAAMDRPIDPSKALPIERINDLLNPGYFEVEAGWCILPNGAGYIANHTPMPGVTVDMINWWFAWHALEDLRYKIWWPDGHFAISLSDGDRAKVLDPNRSMTQKFQGLTHFVIENTGGSSAQKIAISFMTPEDVGFDMSRFKSPNVGTIVAANGASFLLAPPPGAPNFKSAAFMIHFIHEIPGGIEFRTRFWMGYHILNKKPYFLLPQGVRIPDFAPAGLARHNVYEYANLASFLPQLYEEQKGAVP